MAPSLSFHSPTGLSSRSPTGLSFRGEAEESASVSSVEQFLAEEQTRDLLRFSTAGSVDDGKSTLIGRLLYDTQSVYEDNLRSIEGKGTTAPGVLDLALLTDGLRAEREQGITIDVAYRYFSTARRKFIIADTPGHEQYTRNMATGASTASLAIVLVDARKGVLIQSRRHACITALLGVPHILVAVNKMDLVGYDEAVFNKIREDFTSFFDQLATTPGAPPSAAASSSIRMGEAPQSLRPTVYFVPVSALTGDNVVEPTSAMPWYSGPSLLQILESVPAAGTNSENPFRFAVQRVIRPNLDFRGFAGQIAAGTIRPGDAIMALPSRRTSKVRSIVTFDGELKQAHAPQSVNLTLEDELDISRGDLLVDPASTPVVTTRFTASLVWMDEHPLQTNRRYLLKHTSRTVHAQVNAVDYRLDIATLEHQPDSTLTLNAIGVVEIETVQPIAVDRYTGNRITGSFVLIDPVTNATAAAGMIRDAIASAATPTQTGPVSAEERAARWRHIGAHLHLTGSIALADALERALFERGAAILRPDSASPEELAALSAAGALVLTHESADTAAITVAGHHTALASVEDAIRFLEAREILKGAEAR
jgi:small GTP-binding protein